MMMLDEQQKEIGEITPEAVPVFLSLAATYAIENARNIN